MGSERHGLGERWKRLAIIAGGIIFGQIVLYGPSLAGKTVLLPVDLLAQPRWYLPPTDAAIDVVPKNVVFSDPVLSFEMRRRFAASELEAGRWPLWNPYNFLGSPIARSTPYSPFNLIYYLLPAPVSLAWIQLLKSLIAGFGAYLFFRRALAVDFRPAAVGAICYPVTGFFVLWQSYPLSAVVAWLPWVLLATDRAVRRPRGWGGPALAVTTGAALWSESPDVAGQVLLVSGIYALWCLFDAHGRRPGWRTALKSLAAAAGGWLLGLLLATPYLLPLMEYGKMGARTVERAGGGEERPPVGLQALPQTVLPDLYGSFERDHVRLTPGNRLESSAAAYTGLAATLVLAPLAFGSRRRRAQCAMWAIVGVLGVGWSLNLPGLVQVLRLPGLNLMSHNRFVFATSFAILSLAVIGLARIARGEVGRRRVFLVPAVLLLLLTGWLGLRAARLPAQFTAQFTQRIEDGNPAPGLADRSAVERVRRNLEVETRRSAALALLAAGGWLWLWLGGQRRRAALPIAGVVMLGELLLFAHGQAAQCDPALYYPDVEILSRLAQAPPGRVLGVDCLPPALNQRFGLRDVRGKDGVDPLPVLELLRAAGDPSAPSPSFARTLWYRPRTVELEADGARLPPILDLLGVRYLIYRGTPPDGYTPRRVAEDYWIAENPRAMPRAFVPRRIETVADPAQRLRLLAGDAFDPAEVAYVETPVAVPAPARGTATIVTEVPNRIEIEADLETSGLIVLSDLFYPGWRATVDGEPAEILRVNHALRGVVAGAGRHGVEFSYAPASTARGIRLMLAALAGIAVWVISLRRVGRLRFEGLSD